METPPPVHEGHYSHPRFNFESQSLSDAAFGEASLEWWEAAEVNGGRIGAIKDELSSSLKSSPPPKDRSFYLSFTALCVCAFISLLDTVIIASALPAITKALHATSLDAYWCGTAFLFSKTIAQAWYSTYAFTFGHKDCLLVALAIFLIASIICATAQNIDWLIAGRVIQGIGAGGVDSLVNVITSDLTSLNERGKYIGIVSMAGSMGLVTGVVMGAAIAEKTSWRLIFWLHVPTCTIAGVALTVFLAAEKSQTTFLSKLKQVDWIGGTILAASLVGLLYGITSGGVVHSWASAQILCGLIFGSLGIALFVWYEKMLAVRPMLAFNMFHDRTVMSGFFSAWVDGIVLWTIPYFMILYFLVVRSHSLILASVQTLPGIGSVPPSAAVAGIIMALTHRFKYLTLLSWILIAVGVGLLATLDASSPPAAQYSYQVIIAIGGGILFPGRIYAVQAPQRSLSAISVVTGMAAFFTSLGQVCGVSVGGTIFQNRWEMLTDRRVKAGTIPTRFVIEARDAEGAGDIIKALPVVVRRAYEDIMAESIKTVWIFLAAVSAAAFIVSLLMSDLKLDDSALEEEAKEDAEQLS